MKKRLCAMTLSACAWSCGSVDPAAVGDGGSCGHADVGGGSGAEHGGNGNGGGAGAEPVGVGGVDGGSECNPASSPCLWDKSACGTFYLGCDVEVTCDPCETESHWLSCGSNHACACTPATDNTAQEYCLYLNLFYPHLPHDLQPFYCGPALIRAGIGCYSDGVQMPNGEVVTCCPPG